MRLSRQGIDYIVMNRFFYTILILYITCFAFISCKDKNTFDDGGDKYKSEWTEEQKRKYFSDSIAFDLESPETRNKDHSFHSFMREHYRNLKAKNIDNPLIYALEEEYIGTAKIDSNKKWFRITITPCFKTPHCFILEKKMGNTYITLKTTNANSGHLYTGTLDYSFTQVKPSSLYDKLSQKLDSLNFFNLKDDGSFTPGFDGESWTFEWIEKGKYNIIIRWSPNFCGNSTTKELGNIGTKLRNYTKFLDVFYLHDLLLM